MTGTRGAEGLGVVAKLAGFALGVVVAFGVGLGIGAAVGPVGEGAAPAHHGTPASSTAPAGHDDHAISGLSGG